MNAKPIVLLVDDEEDLCTLMSISLTRMGVQTYIAYRIEQAKQLLNTQHFNLCLTDLNLPDGNGIQLLEYISTSFPQLPVAMLSAYGNMEIAIAALKAGAFDFISKPIKPKYLEQLINQILGNPPIDLPAKQPTHLLEYPILIGESEAIQQLKIRLKKISATQAPVLISGESGTGKEVVAHLIHHLSRRCHGPFIAINCGAIPNELMESELFGYAKGSFSGATQHKSGLILAAHGGSLFLDEIAELALHLQVKLLRVIQEKKIRPIGSENEIAVDFRIISASHQNLHDLVQQGQFRQDLFFRLHVLDIMLPPLRERGHDIILLAYHFSRQISQDWQISQKRFTPQAEQFLLAQSYLGNVRELRNMIERAMTFCDGPLIDIHHLHTISSSVIFAQATKNRLALNDARQISPDQADHLSAYSPMPDPESTANLALPHEGLMPYLEKIEKEILLNALYLTHWNQTLAAKKLKMSFRSLRYRLQKFKLDHRD